MKDKKLFLPILIVLTSIGLLIFFLEQHHKVCLQCIKFKLFTPEVLRHYILGFGPWALGVFIGLYALNTVSLLPPIGIMSLAAGFIFGPFLGTVGVMAGAFLGTSATFFISRIFGGGFVDKITKGNPKAVEFQEKLNQKGFVSILLVRLIPLIPWEVVNYAAGLSKITYKDFISATLIGIFPSVVIQTFFSDRLTNFDIRDPKLIAAIAGFVLLVSIPTIYLSWKKKMEKGLDSLSKQTISKSL